MASKKTAAKKPTKGKAKGSGKKKSTAMWAKNMGDASSKAKKKMAWAAKAVAKKAPGFAKQKMKGIDGKTHTYMTRTDSRGRTKVINNGEVAPAGYYGTGRGYYALKKNLRIHDMSPDSQKAFTAAHRAEIMGAARDGTGIGAIDRMGKQGQIFTDGSTVYANFRKDTKLRNMMNEKEAFFDPSLYPHAGKGKKMSKNIIAFGQDGRVK